jgi:hypothetical protein
MVLFPSDKPRSGSDKWFKASNTSTPSMWLIGISNAKTFFFHATGMSNWLISGLLASASTLTV